MPARYDYVTNQYDSEYGDVSDLYGAYLENRDLNEYRRRRGVSVPRLRRDVFRPQEAPKRRENTFTFSEKVLEKIAAQAVRDVDGVDAVDQGVVGLADDREAVVGKPLDEVDLPERALAVERAGDRAAGSVAASDAFFPFADGPQILIDAGVRAIVQPGGSVRDAEVGEACRAEDGVGATIETMERLGLIKRPG